MELVMNYWMYLIGAERTVCRYTDDQQMAELPYLRKATARKFETLGGGGSSNLFHPGPDGSKVCAYNQTRQRFLSVDVEAGDFSPVILNRRLAALTSGSGLALWLVPFRGISPTSVRFPVDLVLLNARGVVLHVVDSFPISQAPSGSAQAASVVVLPAQSIGVTGTSHGDQLLLCPSEEMKQRLQQIEQSGVESQTEQGAAPENRAAQKAGGNVLPFDRNRPASMTEKPRMADDPQVVEAAPPVVEVVPPVVDVPPPAVKVAPPVVASPPAVPESGPPSISAPPVTAAEPGKGRPWVKRNSTQKSWLQKLLAPDPSDPRKSPREELPWLGAYFFTGGKPVAYAIRDISAVGVYVITQERWYPGTVIRVTLVDRRNPTPDRSLTVNAKVVRPAKDGVGLEFVLNDDLRSRGTKSSMDSQVQGVDKEQIELFLDHVRRSK
jgi:PilZ domain